VSRVIESGYVGFMPVEGVPAELEVKATDNQAAVWENGKVKELVARI